jgi:CHRD domain
MVRASKFALLAAIVGALAAALGAAGGAGGAPTGTAAATLRATMSGTVEVPKGDPNGRGTARITTSQSRRRVCYEIRLSRVGTVNAGHIHRGARGKAGEVVVPLFTTARRQPQGCVRGVSRTLIRAIERNPGRYYVNVHNARYPGGAVRGQLHR